MFQRTIICLLALAIAVSMCAQDWEDNLKKLFSQENAELYLQPLAETIGAGMNSGLYTRARVLKPFTPNVRIGTTLVMVPSGQKKFIPIGADEKNNTALGDMGISVLPLPKMQASLGLPWGNEVMVMGWFPMELGSDVGSITQYGGGLKHSISQHFGPLFPVHWAVQGVYQQMDIGDAVSISSFAVNTHASKSLLIFTVYGGIGMEWTNLSAEFNSDFTGDKMTFDLSSNDIRTTVGVRVVPFPFLNVYADYSQAKYPSYNIGIGAGF